MSGRKLRLVILGGLFAAWIGWLAWQTRDAKGPTLSRSQLTAAEVLLLADVSAGADGLPEKEIHIVEVLHGQLPMQGTLAPANLANVRGFRSEGRYLLPLNKFGDQWLITSPPRSPGAEGIQRPWIYPWSERIERQLRNLGY